VRGYFEYVPPLPERAENPKNHKVPIWFGQPNACQKLSIGVYHNFSGFCYLNGIFIKMTSMGGSMRGIDCAHCQIVKMLPWFRERGGYIETKMNQHSNFRRKNGCLGVFLGWESFAHISNAWKNFPDTDLSEVKRFSLWDLFREYAHHMGTFMWLKSTNFFRFEFLHVKKPMSRKNH
jgi:hypothetical protein